MANEIIYCDACGNMIPPSEVARGELYTKGPSSICKSCLAALPPEKRAHIRSEQRSTPTPRSPSRRTPAPAGESARHATTTGGTFLAIAGVALGVLVGVVVALSVVGASRGSSPATPQDAIALPPPVVVPVVPVAPPVEAPDPQQGASGPEKSTASSELDSIRSMIEPSLGRYDVIRTRLLAFLEADSPDASGARALLDDVDSRFAAIAE
jgi:hypothetical protein